MKRIVVAMIGVWVMFSCAAFAADQEPAAQKILVIVNSSNAITDITLQDLKAYFLGEKQFWSKGIPVQLCLYAKGSAENRVFLTKVCALDEAAFQQQWQKKQYQGEAFRPPVLTDNKEFISRFVKEKPGALAICPGPTPPYGVKVVSVDGKRFEDAEYPLSENGKAQN